MDYPPLLSEESDDEMDVSPTTAKSPIKKRLKLKRNQSKKLKTFKIYIENELEWAPAIKHLNTEHEKE